MHTALVDDPMYLYLYIFSANCCGHSGAYGTRELHAPVDLSPRDAVNTCFGFLHSQSSFWFQRVDCWISFSKLRSWVISFQSTDLIFLIIL